MENLGGIVFLVGMVLIGTALYRRFRTKTLHGRPMWILLGVGFGLWVLGGIIIDEAQKSDKRAEDAKAEQQQAASGGGAIREGGPVRKDRPGNGGTLGDAADALLVSAPKENGVLESMNIHEKLGYVLQNLESRGTVCTVKRDGKTVTIEGKRTRYSFMATFTLDSNRKLGKMAVVKSLTLTMAADNDTKTMVGREAHSTLSQLTFWEGVERQPGRPFPQ